jgi:hypothetical protein
MAKIIISHRVDCEERWLFCSKNVKDLIENLWSEHIQGTTHYLKVKERLHDDMPCKCSYPFTTRPIESEIFALFHGCVFDLDAYYDKVDYLVKEVESLPETVLSGALSESVKNFPLYKTPHVKSLFSRPIINESELLIYLYVLMALIRFELDKDIDIASVSRMILNNNTLKRNSGRKE